MLFSQSVADCTMPTPTLNETAQQDSVRLEAGGSWTARHASELEALLQSRQQDHLSGRAATIDLSQVDELDTFGAWFLEKLSRARGGAAFATVPSRFQNLLAEVKQTNRGARPQPSQPPWVLRRMELLGRRATEIGGEFLLLVAMLGEIANAIPRAVVRSRTLISAAHHLDRVAWQAVPIILLITFLIGGIIAQQGIFHFRKFGADDYVVDLVGILVLREIGVLLVAIMVAGRSGSSYTAELGSMKMREEIDALRTMGLDPIGILVLPRVTALVIAMPILTFLGSMSALIGGGLVAWLYGGMSPEIFIDRLREAVSVDHFQVGIIKAPFMALVIGAVACSEGFCVKGSAESLGLQTTTSVVKSIFYVIVMDGMFAVFFASIGM